MRKGAGKKINLARDMDVKNKTLLAKQLGVARSSLYYQPKQPVKDELAKQMIVAVMNDNPAYGHKRIALELSMNKKKVLRIMKKNNLKPQKRRKSKPEKLEDQGKKPANIPNLAKNICPLRPNVLWVGDFTYIPWNNGFIYVATVMDVFNREILGWHIGLHHTADLVIKALEDALKKTNARPIIFHSDQGSEYMSFNCQEILKQLEIKISYSKKASPWENPFQESFYNNFKLELGSTNRFKDLGILTEIIARQIYYYNTDRIHTSLKMPPIQFKKQYYLKNKTTAQLAVYSNIYSPLKVQKVSKEWGT